MARGRQPEIDSANRRISRRIVGDGSAGSAQRRGPVQSVWQAGYALASREQIREGGEGDAHAARPKNRGYLDCAKDLEVVKGRAWVWWRASGPLRAPTGEASPALPMRSDMREAKPAAWHTGAWLRGCRGAANGERHARARRWEAQAWDGAGG